MRVFRLVVGIFVDKKLHGVGSSFLQSVDLRYNIRGWLTHVNKSDLSTGSSFADADAVTADLFGMELLYNTVQAGLNDQTGDKRYWNGNVSALKWKVQPDANASPSSNPIRERSYKFDYTKADQLKKATYQAFGTTAWNQEVNGYNEEMSYDHNGNILSLKRNSWAGGATAFATIDNLTYTYSAGSGNQLKKVEDAASATEGFKNNINTTDEYGYDQNGNLTRDNNKNGGTAGLVYSYNELNKVSQVTLADGRRIVYTYDGSGTRIRKQLFAAGATTASKTTDYVDGFVYENQVLSYFSMPEGRVRTSGTAFVYEYFLSDHLGNTRVSFEAFNNGTTTVARLTQENHYYPYGMSMKGIALRVATPFSPNKQLYNGGSELQDDFGDDPSNYSTFYREYDPVLGRFNAVDPRTDEYSSLSAYHFAFNNPIGFNDPLGDTPADGIGDEAQRRVVLQIGCCPNFKITLDTALCPVCAIPVAPYL